MSTAEYREAALALLRLGTGAVMSPGTIYLLTSGIAVLPHVGFVRADPDRIVYDPVLARVCMDPAAEPRVPVLLLKLDAEDDRGGAVPQLHRLQQHRVEHAIWLVERPLALSLPPARPERCAS